MRRTGAWAWVSCLLASACGPPPAPRIALEYRFSDLEPVDDDASRIDGVELEVVARADRTTELHGIIGGFLYYTRDAQLFRRPLGEGGEVVVGVEVPPGVVLDADGDDVFYSTPDCEVRRNGFRRLGGECVANVEYLFHDAEYLYLFGREPAKWRDPEMALFRMPKTGGKTERLARLPDMGRVFHSERPVFDGTYFYYMDIYGHVFRIAKRWGAPERFLDLPILEARELEWADAQSVYVSSAEALIRVPTNGDPPTEIAKVRGGELAKDEHFAYLATRKALYVASAGGGTWKKVTPLPESVWHVTASGGAAYVWNWDVVLRVDPHGPRARRILELDGVPITSLAAAPDGLLFSAPVHGNGIPPDTQAVSLVSKDGGPALRLFDAPGLAAAPAYEGEVAYYSRLDGGVVRHDLHTGAEQEVVLPESLARTTPDEARAQQTRREARVERDWEDEYYPALSTLVAVDDADVWFADAALSALAVVPKAGGTPALLATFPKPPLAIAVEGGAAYVRYRSENGETLARVERRGGAPLVLRNAKGSNLEFGVAPGGVGWVDGDDELGLWSTGTGFTDVGQLSLLPEREGRAFTPAVFAISGTDVYFSQRESPHDLHGTSRVVRRTRSGGYSILGMGFDVPTLLTPTADALYVVEGGEQASILSGTRGRFRCCTIWKLPR